MAWLWHKAVWIAVASVLLAAACVLALRYWVLPNVGDYRERVAQSVSEAAGQRVTIGQEHPVDVLLVAGRQVLDVLDDLVDTVYA